ncbi:uncharacterized protein LOC108832041 [Raphanus sativus]|uniref:Uncharacterized protein LOC108832041 n=2 Tax=Raphanus sativus TaxID=3726 RepID=A0A9W3CJV2_RAPSA|nr:uncharacterized protein LOC108832041 [Raphanus sativus]
MVNFIPLNALRTKISFPAIRVKIISKWSAKIGGDHHSIMLLGDENGVTIQGSLNYSISLRNEIELKDGDWVEILNFEVGLATDLYRLTKNKYRIKFTESTLFTKIEPLNGSNFLCCANFRAIKRGLYHPKYCVGDLIAHQQPDPANIYNTFFYSMEFSLISLGFTHIKCVAYGALAHNLNAFWRSTTEDVVVCVLRLWRIEWGTGGFKYVTNLQGGSEILFDTDIPDIQFFKAQIPFIEF